MEKDECGGLPALRTPNLGCIVNVFFESLHRNTYRKKKPQKSKGKKTATPCKKHVPTLNFDELEKRMLDSF